jgi:hypothetical protein
VLDASALLAYLQDEGDAKAVDTVLPESVISTVNWSEVMQKCLASGVDVNGLREDFQALGLGFYRSRRSRPRPRRAYGSRPGLMACRSAIAPALASK